MSVSDYFTAKDLREDRYSLGSLVVPLVLMTLLLAGGCATRTVGMQAPLAHDYEGIQWRPLDTIVVQAIIVAPGYTAVVENDPGTDPETLVERIERLPDDVALGPSGRDTSGGATGP